jgi:hypothetical protein
MSISIILAALSKLDATNNNHWTSEGLPRIDTVKFLAGGAEVSRDDITKAAPNFTRTNPVLDAHAPVTTQGDHAASAGTETPPATAVQATEALAPIQGSHHGEVHPQAAEGVESVGEFVYADASVEEKLAFAQTKLAECEQEVVLATRERDAVSAEVDRLVYATHQETTQQDNATAIRDYLSVQAANLEAKAEQLTRFRESGLDLRALVPGPAPLDAALSGRNRKQYRPN